MRWMIGELRICRQVLTLVQTCSQRKAAKVLGSLRFGDQGGVVDGSDGEDGMGVIG